MVVFEDHAPNVAVTIIILVTISMIVFPLRVYTRVKHSAWGSDDWFMLVAVVPFLALSVFCLGSAFMGVGVHKESLDAHHTEVAMMWFFFFEIFFCLSIIPVKLSIAFMLMRVAGPKKIYHYCLWAMSTIFVLMNLISFFYIIFRCDPISFAWDNATTTTAAAAALGGYCLPSEDLADIYYADTAVNIITDWCFALLPIPLLWNLRLNINAKISVAFLLSLGILASLSACIRLQYTVNLNNTDDYLFSVADVMIWGYAENGVGFIVGCISTLRPLFRKIFQLDGCSTGRIIGDSERGGARHPLALPMPRTRDPAYGDPYYIGDEKTLGKSETAVTSSQLESRKGSSSVSASVSGETESGSEAYILQDMRGSERRNGGKVMNDLGGIHVSRSVHQRRD